jgi:hypothetical protein
LGWNVDTTPGDAAGMNASTGFEAAIAALKLSMSRCADA